MGLPWGPARPSAPIRSGRWLGTSSSSLLVTMVTRLQEGGEKPSFPQPFQWHPVGFARTFQPWVRQGARAQPSTQVL